MILNSMQFKCIVLNTKFFNQLLLAYSGEIFDFLKGSKEMLALFKEMCAGCDEVEQFLLIGLKEWCLGTQIAHVIFKYILKVSIF